MRRERESSWRDWGMSAGLLSLVTDVSRKTVHVFEE